MAVLAYDLAPHIAAFRDDTSEGEPTDGKEARFAVLVYLVLRANKRNRAYPGVDTIVTDTGHSKSRVIAALEWLRIRKAIYNVKSDKRVGAEKLVHSNRAVYQLTGIIDLMGQSVKYLYLHPQEIEDHEDIEIGSPIEPTQETQIVESVHLISEIGSPISHLPLYELKESNDRKEEAPLPPVEQREGTQPQGEGKETSSSSASDLSEVISVYEKNIGMIAPAIVTGNANHIGMKEALEEYPKAWIIEAIELTTIRTTKRSWGYALGILSKWKANGKDAVNGKHNQPTAGESPAAPKFKLQFQKTPDCGCNDGYISHGNNTVERCPRCWAKVEVKS